MTSNTAPPAALRKPPRSPRRRPRPALAAVAVTLSLTAVLSACNDADSKAGALKYSECMRAHEVTGFPDPRPDGSINIDRAPGGATSNLDAGNPTFEKADTACKHYLP